MITSSGSYYNRIQKSVSIVLKVSFGFFVCLFGGFFRCFFFAGSVCYSLLSWFWYDSFFPSFFPLFTATHIRFEVQDQSYCTCAIFSMIYNNYNIGCFSNHMIGRLLSNDRYKPYYTKTNENLLTSLY